MESTTWFACPGKLIGRITGDKVWEKYRENSGNQVSIFLQEGLYQILTVQSSSKKDKSQILTQWIQPWLLGKLENASNYI